MRGDLTGRLSQYIKDREIFPARINPVRDETVGADNRRTDPIALNPRHKLRIFAFQRQNPVFEQRGAAKEFLCHFVRFPTLALY